MIAACRPGVVRWPGGCTGTSYRWQDGVGPVGERPTKIDLHFGWPIHYDFGTVEFVDWCRRIGAEPHLNFGLAGASLEDAAAWVEYCNRPGGTHYADLRRRHGREEPLGVRYWQIGNEEYGPWELGHCSPAEYARTAREWAKAMRRVDPEVRLLAIGGVAGNQQDAGDWAWEVLPKVAPWVDYITFHTYWSASPPGCRRPGRRPARRHGPRRLLARPLRRAPGRGGEDRGAGRHRAHRLPHRQRVEHAGAARPLRPPPGQGGLHRVERRPPAGLHEPPPGRPERLLPRLPPARRPRRRHLRQRHAAPLPGPHPGHGGAVGQRGGPDRRGRATGCGSSRATGPGTWRRTTPAPWPWTPGRTAPAFDLPAQRLCGPALPGRLGHPRSRSAGTSVPLPGQPPPQRGAGGRRPPRRRRRPARGPGPPAAPRRPRGDEHARPAGGGAQPQRPRGPGGRPLHLRPAAPRLRRARIAPRGLA